MTVTFVNLTLTTVAFACEVKPLCCAKPCFLVLFFLQKKLLLEFSPREDIHVNVDFGNHFRPRAQTGLTAAVIDEG